MNIRVHLPSTKEGWELLSNKVAEVQSELIINQINKLPCNYERKVEVLEGVRKKIKEMKS